jgi:hypothetical protein
VGGRQIADEGLDMTPPDWSERLLRSLLSDRDRDTVSGDLLEEYREIAVPARGPRGARWWYRRQVAGCVVRSLRRPSLIGLAIGTMLGVMNLIDTARRPLAADEPATMLAWLLAVLAIWSATTVIVTRRTRRLGHAIVVGAILGAATTLVFHAAAVVRVNIFLDAIRHRVDWQNLVARYYQSGFRSLRAYANYEYATHAPVGIALGTIAGAISGMVGYSFRNAVSGSTRDARRAGTT